MPPPQRRDVSLDLLRGLAIAILVVNHIHLDSALEYATGTFLSAAEVLVAVSGVVAGMVFGHRWRTAGARPTAVMLLRRSRKLYVASLAVIVLIGALTLVPGVATGVATESPRVPGHDLYDFEGAGRTAVAMLTLEAGPWQFNILGFFIAALALAPAVLWALDRGWWPAVVAASCALFVAGRAWSVDVLPTQSEGPFPLLVWQALFVHGLVLGWHRDRVTRALRRWRAAIVVLALAAASIQIHRFGYGPDEWARWEATHFNKTTLDPVRVVAMLSGAAAAYLALRRLQSLLGWLLLPLGRNSFYVFIMHVFLCVAVASVPALSDDGIGLVGNSLVQLGCLALLWLMVRRRFLFRWVPR